VLLVTHDVREAVLLGLTPDLLELRLEAGLGTFAELARKPAEAFVTEFLGAQAPPPELRAYF